MRQHKLSLCAGHFQEWFEQHTGKTIHRHSMMARDDRILLAVSGGKDSLVLWEILSLLGYHVDGLHIHLGIDDGTGYSDKSAEACREFARSRSLHLIEVNVMKEHGLSIPEAAARTYRARKRTCSLCGLTRRHIFNRQAEIGQYNVLATGHNMDDEAAALFGNTTHWLSGYLARQSPVLDAVPGAFVRKVKPLCRAYERETTAYALIKNIKYHDLECPYADGATTLENKLLLNDIEASRPGFKQRFYLSFLKAKEEGLFNPSLLDRTHDFQLCTRCGQPTSNAGLCNYCRIWENIHSDTA